MNQKIKIYFRISIFSLLAAILYSSCEVDMDIAIKTNEKRLLVNAEFTNDSVFQRVKLYCSGSLITGKPQETISGAHILVTDKVDTFYYAESNITPGLYKTIDKCCGIGGRTYYLSISNIDIDKDGIMETYSAQSLMPVPVQMDSLISKRGIHPNDKTEGINNIVYFKIFYNGPDYIYKFILAGDKINYGTLSDRLGSGNINNFASEYKMPKVEKQGLFIRNSAYNQTINDIAKGDTLVFEIYNLTKSQFEFLKAFDNNTNGDPFLDNLFDQLKVPSNLPTNIEPSDKAAGYFFVYSISRISKVFDE